MTGSGAQMMLLLSAVLLLPVAFREATATEFNAGGVSGWVVPSDSNALDYKSWANSINPVVGDLLLFNYDPKFHSVLSVTGPAFAACNTSEPLQRWIDGATIVTLQQAGRMWFICGTPTHCSKGQAFYITVNPALESPASGPQSGAGNAAIKASKAVVILLSVIVGICLQVL